MFLKYSAIPLKGSTSMAVDNLSIVSLSKEKLSAYAVVGKGCVFLVIKNVDSALSEANLFILKDLYRSSEQ